jgi:hypothetical protein
VGTQGRCAELHRYRKNLSVAAISVFCPRFSVPRQSMPPLIPFALGSGKNALHGDKKWAATVDMIQGRLLFAGSARDLPNACLPVLLTCVVLKTMLVPERQKDVLLLEELLDMIEHQLCA